jgi:LPS-assembly lipoprotein
MSSSEMPHGRTGEPGRAPAHHRHGWRALARRGLALAACLGLGACGFTLRGVQQLPFSTIALNFPPNSALGTELARNIRTGTNTEIAADPSKAAAVLDLIGETRDRQILTIDAQGRAIEYTLRDRLRFRLRDASGREMIEPTELRVQRDIAFNDSQRLSKESEEVLLYRDMQTDLVQQLLRRIAAAKPYAAAD